jgi:hypothetical protein
MSTQSPVSRHKLPRRLDATEEDLARARDIACAIAAVATGRDPGPMSIVASMSHYVCVGSDVVVKLIDAEGHDRLDLEIALAPHLPPGLGAQLLASGRGQWYTIDVRYACFARVPGGPPGVGLSAVDAKTVQRWAEQAVQRLDALHSWQPSPRVGRALRESPVHEGFISRQALLDQIQGMVTADRNAVIPSHLIDGLLAIAGHAPQHARADVPVHADCDWGNWLADEHDLTALLDFERARFGEPADDWVLLAATSGPHLAAILDVIADATDTEMEALRAACELRDATFITHDIHAALALPEVPPWMLSRVGHLERLVVGRRWW